VASAGSIGVDPSSHPLGEVAVLFDISSEQSTLTREGPLPPSIAIRADVDVQDVSV